MANIDMKTLTIGENTYIVIDAGARTLIGDLSNLDTTAKSNLVAAINEAFNSGGGGTSDYTYLTNKPKINGNTLSGNKSASDLGLGTYSKPSGGIPASDLASGVIPTVPAAATDAPAMDGTAAVGTSTKYAKADHVHPSDTSKADKVTVTTVSDAGTVSQALDAGKIYDFTGALTSLTITLNAATAPAQYHFRFDSGSTAVSLTLPQTVTMPSGFQVEANKHYEIDILDGYGVAMSW